MLIFHTTTKENAEKIVLNGFLDPQGEIIRNHDCTPTEEGIYFANQVVEDGSLDSGANFYFQIEIPEDIIAEYEVTDDANEVVPYREWVIPANTINSYFNDKNIYKAGE